MRSIFTTFDVNHPKTGKPIDWLGSMQIMFDQASLANKTLWNRPTWIACVIFVRLN